MGEGGAIGRRKRTKIRKLAEDSPGPSSIKLEQPIPKCLASQDIMLNVQRFLDPQDLLTLRKTCKTWYDHSKNRAAWIRAAERVCLRNGIQKAWLPVREMSLSDLEHLTLSPSRFLRLLDNHNYDTVRPLLTRSLVPQPRAGDDDTFEINRAFLVPGGRFLITVTCQDADEHLYDAGCLLWDLGFGERYPMKLFPIAHLDFPDRLIITDITLSANGEAVIMPCFREHEDSYSTYIYSVSPGLEQPTFELRAEFNHIPLTAEPLGISEDRFLLWDRATGTVVVWDFENNMTSCWGTKAEDNISYGTTFGKTALLMANKQPTTQVYIYDIPPFEPRVDDFSRLVVSDITPPKLNFVRVCQPSDFSYFRSPHWMQHLLPSPFLAMLDWYESRDREDGTPAIDAHAAQRNGWGMELHAFLQANSAMPTVFPSLMGIAGNYVGPNWSPSSPDPPLKDNCGFADGHFVFFSSQELRNSPTRMLAVTSFSIPDPSLPTRPPHLSCSTIFINPHDRGNAPKPDRYDVCPFSGRVVAVTKDSYSGTKDEIRVMDLLVSPSQM
ncbi:hypothetical protein CC1G_03566 [Coprinopsis cinerea okayama7|uniref:F-box domain-containing protein n=1 Tax=Coprinopsis cinerea (strain Okayama-7 / 130 / ATCC MYA-4618 / FGSC 9003) TaxID=240176 RepID=A8NCK8_COPC7|nr:hypothetical protein CC1G_03566 [Coprinopsis cinerea okayama7\|eukprot:XP_001832552.2 hypothetical protein CC1G_03566 [Coprinopsis cinerea okayama7\